jgi:predicted pyridoxine 5'-phosphate oxidase superfamily flavin-nucleotide-binding protein
MATKYLDLTFTGAVCRAQKQYYGNVGKIVGAPERDPLSQAEAEFIAARDSFYLGSISESGWPYIQHRGGPPGFLRVINETTLAFADYKGNRQLLTTGNVSVNDRVALFLMDYKNRERLVFIDVVSFDWNCPKYITPRYSAEEVEEHVGPLKTRVAELEAQLRKVKS